MPDTIMLQRCCMCKQVGINSPICTDNKPCRFVRRYMDDRGWRYRVMPGTGPNSYKARFNKGGTKSWKALRDLNWASTFDEAQADMNTHAMKNGWKDIHGMVFPEQPNNQKEDSHD